MNGVRKALAFGILWTAVTIAAYFVTRLATRPVGMLFGDVGGVELAMNVASWASKVAIVLAILAAASIALPVALKPASFGRRMRNVVPIWLVVILALGAVAAFFRIGMVGGLTELDPIGDVTFAIGWLSIFGLLATIVMVPLAARAEVPSGAVSRAAGLQLGAAGAAAVTAAAMIALALVVWPAEPAAPGGGPGGPGGGPPAAGGAPSQGAAPGAGGAAPSGAAPGAGVAQGGAASSGAPGGGAQGGAAQGGGAPAGAGGGGGRAPGGGGPPNMDEMVAGAKQDLAIGVAIMTVFALLGLRSGLQAWRGRGQLTAGGPAAAVAEGGGSGAAAAIGAALVVTVIVLLAIQVFRIPLENPPPTEAAVWDSPATEQLVTRTCMDCHSNQVVWPWYAHVAPGNWLTAGHVRSARKSFNLSELDKLRPDRRESLGERMARSFERGNMPPPDYRYMHPGSKLTEAEALALAEGLKTSLAVSE